MSDRDHTGRNVVLVGGAGLAAWWLLSRGKGWGFGSSGDSRKGSTGTTPRRVLIWVRANRIEVDGVTADLSNVIATARGAGEAEVHATGDAITRSVRDVVLGLRAAGVTIYLAGDLGRTDWGAL